MYNKLNLEQVKQFAQEYAKDGGNWGIDSIPYLQVVVFVMCGGGMLGRSAIGKFANTLGANGELSLAQELANKIVNQAFSVMLKV